MQYSQQLRRDTERPSRMNAAAFPFARTHVLIRGGVAVLLRLAALGLLAALAVFLAGATADAQTTPTSVTLVDNTSEADESTLNFGSDRAFWFDTGDSADGYTLTSVELDMTVGDATGTDPPYSLAIYTDDSGVPGSIVGSALTKPASLSTGLNTFTASGDGIELDAGTTYAVVLKVTANGTSGPLVKTTASEDEDGLAGWGLGNHHSRTTRGGSTWPPDTSVGAPQMKLSGYAKNYLAGNIGQASSGTCVITSADCAQKFTTGSNAPGYKLTIVELVAQNTRPTAPTYTVGIYADSSGSPDLSDQKGSDLTKPTSLPSTAGPAQFTASEGGIDLDANTTYWVVVDTSNRGSGSGNSYLAATLSDAEDAGALTGWSVGDAYSWRGYSTTGAWTTISTGNAIKMALLGTAKAADTTAPTVESATIAANGTTLTVQLSETNLQGHNSADYWTYKVNGVSQGTVHASNTDLTAGRINITLSPAVNSGETVLLSYGAPATNRLRDQAGNQLASFTDRSVTNNSTQSAGQPPPSGSNPGGSGAPAEPPPIEPNLAYSPVEWSSNPHAMTQAFPLAMNEISSNRTTNGSGALNLSAIAASLSPERAARSRGYYLSTRVYGLAERPELVRRAPGGLSTILGVGETRHRVVRGSPLVWIKLWHVYQRPATGINTIERLGGPFYPRLNPLLAEPVEICLPAPRADAAIAVRIQGESAWTVLETTERDGRICAETVRVGWLILVEAEE